MAKKSKLPLALIANETARRAALRKRSKALMKKVHQLSVLCGVDACVLVYAPDERAPSAWPSAEEARRVMERFRGVPEIERGRKMLNHEAFLHQRISKLKEQRARQQRENREVEMRTLMLEGLRGRSLHDLSVEDASALAWMVDAKLKEICQKRDEVANRLAMAAPPPPPEQSPGVEAAAQIRSTWLVDMLSPWPENGQVFVVDPISPSQDTLFHFP